MTTGTRAEATASASAVEDLRARIRGQVLTPADAGYAGLRQPFNALHEGRPDLVVSCSGTLDVATAVSFARARHLPVAVRGGGHSVAGLSTADGGLLIDLAPMHAVLVDPDRRVARVQGGALWAEVDRETQAFGLAAPGGVVSHIGVAGLALGGGYGWLRRAHGLSCDNLLEAEVVCADGHIRRAGPDSHPELHWALRGGGGNFGVVTALTLRLHPVGPIAAFAATFYPLDELRDVLRRWRSYVKAAPDEVTSTCLAVTLPAHPSLPEALRERPVAMVGAVYAGDPAEGMREMRPLRQLGSVLCDVSGPTEFTAVQSALDPLYPRARLRAYWRSGYLAELADEAIDAIAARAAVRPAPAALLSTLHLGGAIADVAPADTAFAERAAPYMVSVEGLWSDPADDAATIDWVRSAWDEIGRFGTGRECLNYSGRAGEDLSARVESAFGANLPRLARAKAEYDPANLFRVNHNVQPAH